MPRQLPTKGSLLPSGPRSTGSRRAGPVPAFAEYVRQLWDRRHFISAFASAKMTAQYSQAKLGQVWQVATPLLNALVYYFIFGLLIGTRDGVPDFVPFLVTGVFIFTFTQSSVMAGTQVDLGQPRAWCGRCTSRAPACPSRSA